MKIGEPYNPFGILPGSPLPNWLLRRTDLSQGAKLCYGRLLQFSGKNGQCFPSKETLAIELGVSVRQVSNYITKLKRANLIKTGKDEVNRHCYLFMWPDGILKSDLFSTKAQFAYREFLKSAFWQAIRLLAIRRDRCCVECGSSKKLQVHHLFYRSNWYSTELSDLVTLCKSCHESKHKS